MWCGALSLQATWRIYKDPYNVLANSTTWRAFWSAFCTFNLAIMGSSILPMPYAFSKTGQGPPPGWAHTSRRTSDPFEPVLSVAAAVHECTQASAVSITAQSTGEARG